MNIGTPMVAFRAKKLYFSKNTFTFLSTAIGPVATHS